MCPFRCLIDVLRGASLLKRLSLCPQMASRSQGAQTEGPGVCIEGATARATRFETDANVDEKMSGLADTSLEIFSNSSKANNLGRKR